MMFIYGALECKLEKWKLADHKLRHLFDARTMNLAIYIVYINLKGEFISTILCFSFQNLLICFNICHCSWSIVVRTVAGHRSNCTSVEFHPFGEFFASGSMDTNLKIWDNRKKGCIHTYKGHSQGISTIKFTPDGRWVVSGGFDNVVKVILHTFISPS